MLKDIYWRKYPLDLLNDENMLYIESLMPEQYKYAPYMFYITALKIADDDGVFNLDDGIIFARLMRIDNVSLVFTIANLMRKRNIIYRLFDDAAYCGLVDWEYPKQKARTLDERRKVVEAKLRAEEAKGYSHSDFPTDSCAGKCNDIPQAVQEAPQSGDGKRRNAVQQRQIKGPASESQQADAQKMDDKKQKNVVKTVYDDKNTKNVVKNEKTEREREQRDLQANVNSHTHTEKREITERQERDRTEPDDSSGHGGPTLSPGEQSTADVAEKELTETTESENDTQSLRSNPSEQESAQPSQVINEQERGALYDYLEAFFVKNCYGFNKKQAANAMRKLAAAIESLSDEVNPPETIAAFMCKEFENMTKGKHGKYWMDIPLLPSNMIKPRVWQELVQYAGKILATKANAKKFEDAMKQAMQASEDDHKQVCDEIEGEYLKYNISPDDPNKVAKLLHLKSAEQNAQQQELPADVDIF